MTRRNNFKDDKAIVKNEVHMDYRLPWGNPIDVPVDDVDKYYARQDAHQEREENERAILIKTFRLPTKTKIKSDYSTVKSKKVMSISTLRSNQRQRRRRRRRHRQVDMNISSDCGLEGNYNCIENSSGPHSTSETKIRKPTKFTKAPMDNEKKTDTLKAVERSGLVNTKISVYEKNLGNLLQDDTRPTAYNSSCKPRKAVLGVPLVGMHSTNSYPVVTSVKSYSTKSNAASSDPLQISIIDKTVVNSSSKAPSAISLRKNKRKAPSIPSSNVVDTEVQFPRSSITFTNSSNHSNKFYNSNITYPIKFTKNPYFTTKSDQLKLGRDFNEAKEFNRSMLTMPQSAFVNLPSIDEKRKTLYAKDVDGDEAIKVLSSLCLNPLARNSKRASFMMW